MGVFEDWKEEMERRREARESHGAQGQEGQEGGATSPQEESEGPGPADQSRGLAIQPTGIPDFQSPMPPAPPGLVHTGTILTTQPRRRVIKDKVQTKYFCNALSFEPLASGGIAKKQTVVIAEDFAAVKLAALADNYAAKLQYRVTPNDEGFTDLPGFLSLFGTGAYPLVLEPPAYFRGGGGGTTLAVICDDRQLVAAANNIFIAFHGMKVLRQPILPTRVYDYSKPFTYLANFTADDNGPGAVGASAAASFNLHVDTDSDFECRKVTIVGDGPITILISSQQDDWMNTAIRGELFGMSLVEHPTFLAAGGGSSGEHPFFLPASRWIPGGTDIKTSVTDKSAASNRVQVAYHGVRYYPAGGTRE